jgi:hypothetical protein
MVKFMNYLVQRHGYHVDILVEGALRPAARVYILLDKVGLYPVCDDQGRFLFSVRSIEDAVPEFERYYMDHPPPWQPLYTTRDQKGMPPSFTRRTAFGELRILQNWNCKWFALRDGEPLLCKSGVAAFCSCSQAQRVADEHLCDYSKPLSEGHDYWWPDPEEERELDRKIDQLLG